MQMSLGRPTRMWGNNNKINLMEMRSANSNWILVGHDAIQWWILENVLMKQWISRNETKII
jgi:hypothetical protein